MDFIADCLKSIEPSIVYMYKRLKLYLALTRCWSTVYPEEWVIVTFRYKYTCTGTLQEIRHSRQQ